VWVPPEAKAAPFFMPSKKSKSKANRIKYTDRFAPGETDSSGIPYDECVAWCEQYYPARARMVLTGRRVLLVVGKADYPTQIWSMRNDHHEGVCHLEWERQEEDEGEC